MMRLFLCRTSSRQLPFLLLLFLVCCVRAWFPRTTEDQAILDSYRRRSCCSKRRQSTQRRPEQLVEHIQHPRGGGDGRVLDNTVDSTTTECGRKVDETLENTATDATAVLAADMCAFF
mmetsp:Transcript_9738/g.19737  ORF Transcript_9738/g.19737 Transcript_9738/m.19737 type:complete len:118 (+) Transcript_9738:3-356(+)|eukprot:scaffold561_cov162-Amphora_coffeaeformis.AAC.22